MKSNVTIKYYKHNPKYKANLPKNVLANTMQIVEYTFLLLYQHANGQVNNLAYNIIVIISD